MADRGIIFSAPMVLALLAGRKTQTRRLLKPQPRKWEARVIDIREPVFDDEFGQWGQWETIWNRCSAMWEPEEDIFHPIRLPHAPGDRLWVREAFGRNTAAFGPEFVYRAEHGKAAAVSEIDLKAGVTRLHVPRWTPSIHMPRAYSRITLIVEAVKVERVQEISEGDAIAEGVQPFEDIFHVDHDHHAARASTSYMALWNTLHTKPGERWEDNPWVSATTFSVIQANIDAIDPTPSQGGGR